MASNEINILFLIENLGLYYLRYVAHFVTNCTYVKIILQLQFAICVLIFTLYKILQISNEIV